MALEYPDDPEMQVSHETIYMSLFVQGRGALRQELHTCLRTGRALRRPKARTKGGFGQGQITDMVMISERPAEAKDRAVPGHWEGDLIYGRRMTTIGTLVERSTRYVMLFALPNGHSAEAVRTAMAKKIRSLPTELRRSLTWDQGKEMAEHARFTIDTGLQIYFCDPEVTLAARQQREHQRTASPVSAQDHRPLDGHPDRAQRHCPVPQRAPSTNARLEVTI